MRQEKNAAVTIQAGYRGFKARQQVQIMRYNQRSKPVFKENPKPTTVIVFFWGGVYCAFFGCCQINIELQEND